MTEPITTIEVCKYCGKKFRRLIKSSTTRSKAYTKNVGIRTINCITCSSECSKKYSYGLYSRKKQEDV